MHLVKHSKEFLNNETNECNENYDDESCNEKLKKEPL